MKKRNLAIVMAMAMAMTTFGGVTVFAADKKQKRKQKRKQKQRQKVMTTQLHMYLQQ